MEEMQGTKEKGMVSRLGRGLKCVRRGDRGRGGTDTFSLHYEVCFEQPHEPDQYDFSYKRVHGNAPLHTVDLIRHATTSIVHFVTDPRLDNNDNLLQTPVKITCIRQAGP